MICFGNFRNIIKVVIGKFKGKIFKYKGVRREMRIEGVRDIRVFLL